MLGNKNEDSHALREMTLEEELLVIDIPVDVRNRMIRKIRDLEGYNSAPKTSECARDDQAYIKELERKNKCLTSQCTALKMALINVLDVVQEDMFMEEQR